MRPRPLVAAALLLDAIVRQCERVAIAYLWRPMLRDPDDAMALETAVNGGARWIITFNVDDYAEAERFGVSVGQPSPAVPAG